MDQTNMVTTALFGEPAYDGNDRRNSDVAASPPSPTTNEHSVSELIAKYPLLAVTAVGTVALLFAVAIRKSSAGAHIQPQLARYVRFMDKAARREYRRSDLGNRIVALPGSLSRPEVTQFVTQALEQLQRAVAGKKR